MNWVRSVFKRYYASMHVPPPEDIALREWMFKNWKDKSYRYADPGRYFTFRNGKELRTFLIKSVPSAAYISVARHRQPEIRQGWMYSDLVFDIDYDHIKEDATFKEGIKIAKRETLKLVSILSTDFGIDDVDITFSGRRGFHVRANGPGLRDIDKRGRIDIANYFTQRGMGKRVLSTDSIILFLEHINSLDKSEARAEIAMCEGISPRTISKLVNNTDKIIKYVKEGRLDVIVPMKTWDQIVPWFRCEIDSGVTTDIKRQLRLPCSLHGKTGLRVVPLDIDLIKSFNPPEDASPFPDEDVIIKTSEGEKVEVPLYEGLMGCLGGTMQKA